MAGAAARHQRSFGRTAGELARMQPVEPIILLESLEKRYDLGGEAEVRALRGVNLIVNPGSYVAIMGASGSGKSTLLNLIGCLDRPTSGHYFLGGTDVSRMPDDELSEARGARIGFIFQSYNLIAQLTVIENIQVPLLYQGKDLHAYHERCVKLASMVGLEKRLNHRPNQLSGGQQQRVAVARSLVNDPLLILADEPTGNLDSRTGQEVLELIDTLNAQGKTIVLVTHDERIATRAHRVLHMRDGLIEREVVNRPEGRAHHSVRAADALDQANVVGSTATDGAHGVTRPTPA
jgi:putative ABC transport system ATP-binding protein